ncbi:MAG: serine hydrolase [Oscillospiraceae bacterium]|nr:serine hydrolase [Oscillospiraceae bacterium]
MDFSKVGAFLDEQVKLGLPMGQVLVTKDYETVYSHNAGWQDAEKTVPASDDTLCWCFSNTKVYTATCLARLIEAGKIGLDDPVSNYLPEFAEISYKDGDEIKKATKPLTVRHLITMTSGLSYAYKRDYPHFTEAVQKPGVTTREAVAAFVKDPWEFEPGTEFLYGFSHDVVAAVIEVASGMRFSEYMRKIIFEPLGIRDTGFRPNEEQKTRFAAMYRSVPETGEIVLREAQVNEFTFCENYESGGGGLFSCPKEYGKLLTVLACGGVSKDGYRLLKPETIDLMSKNQLVGKPWYTYHHEGGREIRRPGYGYGLGVRVHMDPAASGRKTSVGEFGWTGAAGALSVIDPKKRLAIVYAQHVRGKGKQKTMIREALINLVCEALDA